MLVHSCWQPAKNQPWEKKTRQIQAKNSDFILNPADPTIYGWLMWSSSYHDRRTWHNLNVERTLELNWVSFSFFTAGSNSETTQLAWGWFNKGKVSFKAILLFSQMHRYLTSLLPELLTTVCYNCIRIETTWDRLTQSTLDYKHVSISRLELDFLVGLSNEGRRERAVFSLRVVSRASPTFRKEFLCSSHVTTYSFVI